MPLLFLNAKSVLQNRGTDRTALPFDQKAT
jgi:hypothetical protein